MCRKRIVGLLMVAMLLVAVSVAAGAGLEQYLSSQVVCGEQAQSLINQGDEDQASELLAQGVKRFPDSDWLRSLYGRALFSQGKLDEAEDQFQKALDINKDNPVARMLIKEIRLTKDALKDRELSELIDLGMDKAGDLLVIIIGVWIGTLMTAFSARMAKAFSRSHFERALKRKNWDEATDILENFIANWKKRELRINMEMMLSKMPQEEVETIIRDYVDVQKHEDELLFFLRKLHSKRG